jgi:hypothetical protein
MQDKRTQVGRCGRGGDRCMQDKVTQAGSCGGGGAEACRIREHKQKGVEWGWGYRGMEDKEK